MSTTVTSMSAEALAFLAVANADIRADCGSAILKANATDLMRRAGEPLRVGPGDVHGRRTVNGYDRGDSYAT